MKKTDIRVMKEIIITRDEITIPEGWHLVKEPTKMIENGQDFFKAVIAKA